MWFDIEHARAGLGWQPRYSNDEMLAASYELTNAPSMLAAEGAAG